MAGPQMLPMYVPTRKDRPVDPEWTCQKSGDCCTLPKEVVMTKEEASILVASAPPTVAMEFRPVDDKFVAMKAGPCPLYAFHTCLVYSVRPFNCRRFGCMRPDTHTEPFEASGANMRDRTETNRTARRMGIQMQKKAQKWAIAHGWGE